MSMQEEAPLTVNPADIEWTTTTYVLWFGAYGSTYLRAYANNLSDALDECIDFIAEFAPGLLANDQVNEEFAEEIAKYGGAPTEEETYAAWEIATQDTTCGGNCGDYLHSWEWGLVSEERHDLY